MRYLLSILTLVVAFSTLNAQAPQMLNYQGVARNINGTPLNNQAIKLRLSVQSAGGNAFYVESHSPTTNAFGLYALQIGQGTVISGNFSNIYWAQNKTFLKVEIDPTGGNNFTPVGSPAQLISVPYALEAEHAASTELGGDVTGNSTFSIVTGLQGRPVDAAEPNTGDVLKWNGSEWTPASGGAYSAGSGISISGNTIYNTGDLDEYNELQSIYLVGNTLTLSDGGGSVTLPGGGGGGSFSLPYSGTQNNSNSLFNITNTGSGGAIHAVSNNGSGPLGAAVYGKNTTADGMGVRGEADFAGVLGFSDSGFGVYAESTNGTAILAGSSGGNGIQVSCGSGTGIKVSGNGIGIDVVTNSNFQPGIRGESSAGGNGVLGVSDYGAGVVGVTNYSAGTGGRFVNDYGGVALESIGSFSISAEMGGAVYSNILNGETTAVGGVSLQGRFIPSIDNAFTLGISGNRWSAVYAANGTINTSDARQKQAIQPIGYGLQQVMAMKPVSFEWKDNPAQGRKLGFLAQDLQAIVPEVVADQEWATDKAGNMTSKPADVLGVYYSDLIPVLAKAVQEQQVLIEQLQQQNALLVKRVTALEHQ